MTGKAVVNAKEPAEIDELKNAAPVTPKPPWVINTPPVTPMPPD